MVRVRIGVECIPLLPIDLSGTIPLSNSQAETRESSHTLDVQAGEYPFGVMNGFPLELQGCSVENEATWPGQLGEPLPNARDLHLPDEESLADGRT